MKTAVLAALSMLILGIGAPPARAQLAPYNEDGMTYGHVHLNVSDVARHTELWKEHLGGEVYERGPITVVRFPAMLLILTEREPTAGSMSTVMDHFGFKVRDIDRILDGWRAAGREVQAEFTGAEGFPNAYVLFPDGVRVELQEDPELEEEVVGYHVHWFTESHEELLDWYIDVFGVERSVRGSIETTANAPGMNLSFGGTRSERTGTRGAAIDHVGFEVRDLDAFAEELKEKGIELDTPVGEVPSLGLKYAFLTDPAGVVIELTQGLIEY